METNLQRYVVPFTNIASKLNDCLHSLDLTFNVGVEVLFLDLWEA